MSFSLNASSALHNSIMEIRNVNRYKVQNVSSNLFEGFFKNGCTLGEVSLDSANTFSSSVDHN